jgi:hypothetical protein
MTQIATSLPTQPSIGSTQSQLTLADYLDHFLARAGVKRAHHRVTPGLYALGNPSPDAPVFVTANYTLSFDALRAALSGIDGYILVLDTQGVNVWCAAGEGTFGTEELVRRIEACRLKEVVSQRILILPQLGGPGIAAHEVRKRSGFKVEYGPVRAPDLPEYMKSRRATPEMRLVRFTLGDRLTVAAVDVMRAILPMLVVAAVLYFLGGVWAGAAAVATGLSGLLLFPALLPWLPGKDFSSKGLFLGLATALPFAIAMLLRQPEAAWWLRAGNVLCYLLSMPPVVAYLALLYTGSTTFSSRSGVKKEIFTYIPRLAWMLGAGVILWIAVVVIGRLGRF